MSREDGLVLLILGVSLCFCALGLQDAGYLRFSDSIVSGIKLTDLLLAAFAFMQVVVMGRQAKIMQKQAEIASQAMTITKWPYLYVTDFVFRTPISAGSGSGIPEFQYYLKVHGETPAIIRAFSHSLIFAMDISPDSKRRYDELPTATMMFDKNMWGQAVQLPRSEFSRFENEIRLKSLSRRRYFAAVSLIYEDVFGNRHEVAFCYRANIYGEDGELYGGPKLNYQRILDASTVIQNQHGQIILR